MATLANGNRMDREELVDDLRQLVMKRIDPAEAIKLDRPKLQSKIFQTLSDITEEQRIGINLREQQFVTSELLNDIVGLGPLEALLNDGSINDILVNGYNSVYVERFGKLEKTDLNFRNPTHVLNVARRIASRIGRRIDESSPMVDARLEDGSRVNIIINPLSRSGTCISIRKFPQQKLVLSDMVDNGNMSADMATFLQLAVEAKLNIIVSGGTGAGKTTILNAISRFIPENERIVTIEDAAELQLQQDHVISLETRPMSIENTGEVTQRDLVKNALRMRPDRIILGEVRGQEAFDMMQAMNTGHDGSISTIHANTTADALVRLENMLNMSDMKLPQIVIQKQIASSIDLIVQIERSIDGRRRVIDIAEVHEGDEGELKANSLFRFDVESASPEEVVGLHEQKSELIYNSYKFLHAGKGRAIEKMFRLKELV